MVVIHKERVARKRKKHRNYLLWTCAPQGARATRQKKYSHNEPEQPCAVLIPYNGLCERLWAPDAWPSAIEFTRIAEARRRKTEG